MRKGMLPAGVAVMAAVLLVGCGAGAASGAAAGSAGQGGASGTAARGAGGAQAAGPGGGPGANAAQATGAGAGARQGAAGQQGGGRRFAAVMVQTVTVPSGPLVTDNETAGTVVPVTQSQVAAQVAGVVARVLRRQGDSVLAGAVVVQLDDSSLRLAAQNAQATLDNARINLAMGQQTTTGSGPKLDAQLQSAQNAFSAAQKNYDSQKALLDLGGISAAQLDNAQASLDTARANVEAAKLALQQNTQADTQNIAQLKLAVDQATNQLAIARLALENASIKAPFTGQISSISVSPGMYVGLTSAVFQLVSMDKQVNFTMPPSDAPSFKAGDSVTFTYNGKSYTVRLAQDPSAPINGVVPMVAAIPRALPAGYGSVGTVGYKLVVGAGPQIPIAALQTRADTNFVYVVVNGAAQEAPVLITAESGSTAVVQGVKQGDQVVINPPPGLLPGSTVQVMAQGGAAGAQGAGVKQGGAASAAGAAGVRTGQQGGQGQRTPGQAAGGQGRQGAGGAPGAAAGATP
jgi:HlyD family secretion protein